MDHIVVCGNSLREAADYIETKLGVRLEKGGSHQQFGTHNRLLGLETGIYIEAIAINPELNKPPYPRWFNLDNFSGAPRITNWVCNSENLKISMKNIFLDDFKIVSMSRNNFKWLMALPKNGILPFGGGFPAILEWKTDSPSERLISSNCRLKQLVIFHPSATKLERKLKKFKDDRVSFEPSNEIKLTAEFYTPHGIRTVD